MEIFPKKVIRKFGPPYFVPFPQTWRQVPAHGKSARRQKLGQKKNSSGFALNLVLFSFQLIWMHSNLAVSVLDSQSRGSGFKSWPWQKFGSRFLLRLRPLSNSAMTSTLSVENETVRERN